MKHCHIPLWTHSFHHFKIQRKVSLIFILVTNSKNKNVFYYRLILVTAGRNVVLRGSGLKRQVLWASFVFPFSFEANHPPTGDNEAQMSLPCVLPQGWLEDTVISSPHSLEVQNASSYREAMLSSPGQRSNLQFLDPTLCFWVSGVISAKHHSA